MRLGVGGNMEPVGNEVFLNMDCHGTQLVARTPAGNTLPECGSTVDLAFALSALHFFDAQSGQRIDT